MAAQPKRKHSRQRKGKRQAAAKRKFLKIVHQKILLSIKENEMGQSEDTT